MDRFLAQNNGHQKQASFALFAQADAVGCVDLWCLVYPSDRDFFMLFSKTQIFLDGSYLCL